MERHWQLEVDAGRRCGAPVLAGRGIMHRLFRSWRTTACRPSPSHSTGHPHKARPRRRRWLLIASAASATLLCAARAPTARWLMFVPPIGSKRSPGEKMVETDRVAGSYELSTLRSRMDGVAPESQEPRDWQSTAASILIGGCVSLALVAGVWLSDGTKASAETNDIAGAPEKIVRMIQQSKEATGPELSSQGPLTVLSKTGQEKLVQMYEKIFAATKDLRGEDDPYTEVRGYKIEKAALEKVRKVEDVLDEMQKDIYSESWVSLATYPGLLRSYVPLLTYYTDAAFPEGSGVVNEQLRFALRYEVGRMFSAVHDFDIAVSQRSIRNVERAFAQASLAYDRYLKAGDLYTGYDPVTSTTVFFENIDERSLVYQRLSLGQPGIRDEVLVIQGPDKGKVGKVIWLGRQDEKDLQSPIVTAVVKLESNPTMGNLGGSAGVKEVKAYPYAWIAVTQSASASYMEDWTLAAVAAIVSCSITYPLDTLKVRVQSGLPGIPKDGIGGLFNGLLFNLGQMVPQAGFLMAGFNAFTRVAIGLPWIDANNPEIKFLVMIPAGVVAISLGSPLRAPFEELNKQIQTGAAKSDGEAIKQVFQERPMEEVIASFGTTTALVLLRGIPYGALQCTTYELFKDKLLGPWEAAQLPIAAEPFVVGALSGFVTGYLTNPPDVVMTRVAGAVTGDSEEQGADIGAIWNRIVNVSKDVAEKEGPQGFLNGALERALYFAPEACFWFAGYEYLKRVALVFQDA
eukprot:TRINITY_DN26648_c0_g1_i1.p1 TRINITY_DN26648_c0_g1~~TRINITY_DN26648_c0_g1_i1.p1  ORF type:complete len:787 (-),score=113.08 TRINITY_DN26648_c0_g1_i1:285-2513(-)